MRTALILALAPTLALCQEPEPMGHIGLQIGQAQYDTGPFDADSLAYSVFGGGRAGDHFVAEVAVAQANEFSQGPVSVQVRMYSLRAFARLPVEDRFAFLAGLGLNKIDATTRAPGISIDTEDSERSWILAGEVSTGQSLIRLSYESLDMEDADASALMLGVAYRFE